MSYSLPRYTVSLVKESSIKVESYPKLLSSADVHKLMRTLFDGLDREHFKIACLDSKHQLIGIHTVSVGSLSLSIVHPREAFKAAILLSSAALILMHNHPSGDPTPSQEDRALTRRLKDGGELLGIAVLDHLVLGDWRYYSFADHQAL